MNDSTRKLLASISAILLSGYFGLRAFAELERGQLLYFAISAAFSLGMAATLIGIYRKASEGKLYSTVILLGGLPSVGLIGLSGWMMYSGVWSFSTVLSLLLGLIGLFTVNEAISDDSYVEAND